MRRRRGRPVAGLVACGLLAAGTAQAVLPQPPARLDGVTLPDGKLLGITHSDRMAVFVDLDRTRMTGPVKDLWLFEVYNPGLPGADGALVVQAIEHHHLDCAAHTDQLLAEKGFDRRQTMVMWLQESPPEANDQGFFQQLEAVMCARDSLPADGALAGHQAAYVQGMTWLGVRP